MLPIAVYRTVLEFLLVVLIVGLLVFFAVSAYNPCRIKAMVSGVAGPFARVRTDSQLYYALHGRWPENTARYPEKTKGKKAYDSEIRRRFQIDIENGAATFTFKKETGPLAGKTITLRPAVFRENPAGPVHWVCGTPAENNATKIFGTDRTRVGPKYIPRQMQ